MKHSITFVVAGALLALSSSASADVVARQAIITLHNVTDLDSVNADYGTTVLDSIESRKTYLLSIPEGWTENEFELVLEADPRIADADVNDETDAPGGSTQSFYLSIGESELGGQYAWPLIRLSDAQTIELGANVVVAVLDTGIDLNHISLASVQVLAGVDFTDSATGVLDVGDGQDTDGDGFVDELVGHGTFNAGVIAQIAPEVQILPIRVLDGDGTGNAFRVAKGIYYAVDAGVDIINLSLNTDAENEILSQSVEYAKDHDVLVIASLGNDNSHETVFPAGFSSVLGVAGTDPTDVKCAFSNYGHYADISAPALEIDSLIPGNQFGEADGTSASSAILAGCAALVRATNSSLDRQEIFQIIESTAVDIDGLNPAYAGMLGAGRVDVGAAVAEANRLLADLDHDGKVNVVDLFHLLAFWGSADSASDLDNSGTVDVLDLFLLLTSWG